MQNKPIDVALEPYVKELYKKAHEKAEKHFKTKISDKILNIEHFDEFQLLITELNRIDRLIKLNKHSYYFLNFEDEDTLLKHFSNRYYLLSNDESDEFIESVFLGKIQSLINETCFNLEEQIPKCTFEDFISGKECNYFNINGLSFNIKEEDFYKILNWRLNTLMKIVSYEVELLMKNYQEYCATIENPLDFIINQVKILEELSIESLNDAKKLKRILSKLFVFKDVDLKEYNNELLLYNYHTYFSDDKKDIKPSTVNQVLNRLSSDPKTLISNEYTLFYTLASFLFCLKDLIKNESILTPFKYPNWKDLLNEIIKQAKQKVELYIKEIKDFVNNPANNENDIRNYIRTEFDRQRIIYNKFEDKNKISLIINNDRNELITDFIINSLFYDNKDEYLKKVKEVFVFHKSIWEIINIHYGIFSPEPIYVKKNVEVSLIRDDLIDYMVVDSDVYKEFTSLSEYYYKRGIYDEMPREIQFYNKKEKFELLYNKMDSHFKKVLKNGEPDSKMMYIISKLDDLKDKKIERLKRLKELKLNKDEYKELLKGDQLRLLTKRLKNEEKKLKKSKTVKYIPVPLSTPKPIVPKSVYQSFKYLDYDKNIDAIADLKDSLVKNKFIAESTKLSDFKKIFSGGEINNKIIWTGYIGDLSYFIKKMIEDETKIENPKQKHWMITTNCFSMLDGTEINSDKLTWAKATVRSHLAEKALKHL